MHLKDTKSISFQNMNLGAFNPQWLLMTIMPTFKPDRDSSFEKISSIIRDSSTCIHEKIHWYQFAGTSWGIFCLMLQHTLMSHFISHSKYYGFPSILCFSDHFSLSKNGNLEMTTPGPSMRDISFFQGWRDLKFLYRLFVFGGEDEINLDPYCLPGGVGAVLTDWHQEKCEYYGIEDHKTVEELDQFFSFDKYQFVMNSKGHLLSVKDLIEGQARANDLIYLMRTSSKFNINIKDFNAFINGYLCEGTYWNAFQYFSEVVNFDTMDSTKLVDNLIKLCILIDIAFACPFVPNILGSAIHTPCEWADFYPTMRFAFACQASLNMGNKYDLTTVEGQKQYGDDICKRLNWKTPERLAHEFVNNRSSRLDNFKVAWEEKEDKFDFMKYSMKDFFQYVYYKFSECRIKVPSYLALPGLFDSSKLASKVLQMLHAGSSKLWNVSPFYINEGDRSVKSNIESDERVLWLQYMTIAYNLVADYIVPQKPIQINKLPYNISDSCRHNMRGSIIKMFNVDIGEHWNKMNLMH